MFFFIPWGQWSWIVKILLFQWDKILWVSGLLHYNVSQFITLHTMYGLSPSTCLPLHWLYDILFMDCLPLHWLYDILSMDCLPLYWLYDILCMDCLPLHWFFDILCMDCLPLHWLYDILCMDCLTLQWLYDILCMDCLPLHWLYDILCMDCLTLQWLYDILCMNCLLSHWLYDTLFMDCLPLQWQYELPAADKAAESDISTIRDASGHKLQELQWWVFCWPVGDLMVAGWLIRVINTYTYDIYNCKDCRHTDISCSYNWNKTKTYATLTYSLFTCKCLLVDKRLLLFDYLKVHQVLKKMFYFLSNKSWGMLLKKSWIVYCKLLSFATCISVRNYSCGPSPIPECFPPDPRDILQEMGIEHRRIALGELQMEGELAGGHLYSVFHH